MNVNRRWLYGGVFFIALGAVLLAGQGDAVDGDVIAQAARLWPILVIALGVGLLLHRTRFSVAGGMIAAAVPGSCSAGCSSRPQSPWRRSAQRATTSSRRASRRARARSTAPRP